MKIEYDSTLDLLYVWFKRSGTKSSRTETLVPGILIDFTEDDELIGIEVIDAAAALGEKISFEGFEEHAGTPPVLADASRSARP